MIQKPVPVIRAVYVRYLLDTLHTEDGDFEAALEGHGLPALPPDNPDGYLPLERVLSFAASAVAETGADDLGLRAGQQIQVSDLNPGLQAALAEAATLEAALQAFCRLAEREMAPTAWSMARCGDQVRISSDLGTAKDACGAWLAIMTLIAVIRRFAGCDWTPATIAFQTPGPVGKKACRTFPNTRILAGTRETGIAFPNSLLGLRALPCPNTLPGRPLRANGATAPCREGWDFPASLRAVLASYLDDGNLSIELAAGIAGTSVRSLQRRLGRLGLTYSGLLADVRVDMARRMLADREVKVIDTAYALGYSDPAHFTRAFRRIVGISPQRYREQSWVA